MNEQVDNRMTAEEVIAGYSINIWVGGSMRHLVGQDAIDYLTMLAEFGSEINGSN